MASFFRQRPGATVFGVFWVCALLTAVLVVGWCWPYRLADPQTAGREDLVRWLVVRDLAREPYENQRVLARRLDEEFFAAGIDWGEMSERLSQPQRRQVIENLQVLFVPWCRDKAARFAAEAPEGRESFLDETLDRIELLADAGRIIDEAGGDSPGALASRLLGAVELRISGEESEEVRHFLDSLKRQWLVRQLRQWFPPTARGHDPPEGG